MIIVRYIALTFLAFSACSGDPSPTLNSDGGTADLAAGSSKGGRTGVEGYCDRYKVCGGSYYATAQSCIDAAVGYWGACRKTELDAFGDCMRAQDCSIAGSDGYIPSQTPCASQYSTLQAAPACK